MESTRWGKWETAPEPSRERSQKLAPVVRALTHALRPNTLPAPYARAHPQNQDGFCNRMEICAFNASTEHIAMMQENFFHFCSFIHAWEAIFFYETGGERPLLIIIY